MGFFKNDGISQYDKMTKTPISKLIVTLSIPTIISMLVSNVYNLVDTAFVGKLGNSASGAVGIVFGYMSILQAIGFLFGQGAGSMMSRKLGQKDIKEASRIASTGFAFSFMISTLIAILSWVFLDDIIMLLGSTETIAPYAKTYISFIIITAPFVASSFTLNNLLRYEGKALFAMIGLFTGAILNIGGDAIFMFGMNMGIAGAGLSTAISQVVSFALLLGAFLRKKTQSELSIENVSFDMKRVWTIVSTGFPSLLRQALNSVSTIILNIQAAAYGGDEAVAAMSIVSRIIFFVFAVAIGTGQGFQPVSAFNYGAGKYSRVRKAYKFTTIMSECCMLVFTFTVLLTAKNLIQIFRDDPTVIEIGTRALILQVCAQIVLPISMVCEMLYQSTGRRLGASILSAMRSGIIFIPAILILPRIRGLYGVEEAQPLAFVLSLPIAIIFITLFFKKTPKEDLPEKVEG